MHEQRTKPSRFYRIDDIPSLPMVCDLDSASIAITIVQPSASYYTIDFQLINIFRHEFYCIYNTFRHEFCYIFNTFRGQRYYIFLNCAKDLAKKSCKSSVALLSVFSRSSVGRIRQGIRNDNLNKSHFLETKKTRVCPRLFLYFASKL